MAILVNPRPQTPAPRRETRFTLLLTSDPDALRRPQS